MSLLLAVGTISEAAKQPITLLQALEITATGLVGIFAVFFVIWGFVTLLNKVTGGKAKEDEE
ncbi:MAG TPA: hypothetical protein VN512_01145 [Clostridia bacterium]|nr:hypothetical protein [Clostridia bacterium]